MHAHSAWRLVMILAGSAETVRQIIALSANPFVFIILFLVVCLLKALKMERTPNNDRFDR